MKQPFNSSKPTNIKPPESKPSTPPSQVQASESLGHSYESVFVTDRWLWRCRVCLASPDLIIGSKLTCEDIKRQDKEREARRAIE